LLYLLHIIAVAIGAATAIVILLGGRQNYLYYAGKLHKNDLIPYLIVEIMSSLAAFLCVYTCCIKNIISYSILYDKKT
jgi:hypothetical protein